MKTKLVSIIFVLLLAGCSINFNIKEQAKKEIDGTISRDITVTIAPEEVNKIVNTLGEEINKIKTNNEISVEKNIGWYALKTLENKTYYGQIENTSSDPVVLKNWFINYEDYISGDKTTVQNSTLKLLSGSQLDQRSQKQLAIDRKTILFMEPLNEDSKILKAILDYKPSNTNSQKTNWYTIQATNGETFFGQISDIRSEQITLNGYYYSYDKNYNSTSGNLRLVKSVEKKTLTQKDIAFLQSLNNDSKIYLAILDYEK